MTSTSHSPRARQADPAQRQKILDEHFATLAALLDDATFHLLEGLGVTAGWYCWEAGAGTTTVPQWLADRVGSTGHVLATDIDTSRLTANRAPALTVQPHQ